MTSSGKLAIVYIESYNNPARSNFVLFDFTARSGLPTSPRNRVSPVNKYFGTYFSLINRHYDSIVWPGVWIVYIYNFPKLNISLFFD